MSFVPGGESRTRKHSKTVPKATEEDPGLAKFGIAPGLGACNTPSADRKMQIPQPLVNTGVLALLLLRKNSENRRLTTWLTTTAENTKKLNIRV